MGLPCGLSAGLFGLDDRLPGCGESSGKLMPSVFALDWIDGKLSSLAAPHGMSTMAATGSYRQHMRNQEPIGASASMRRAK